MKFPDCPMRTGEVCRVATELAGTTASVTPSICRVCLKSAYPRAVNLATVGAARRAAEAVGTPKVAELERMTLSVLSGSAAPPPPTPPAEGPGTELERLLSTMGYSASKHCACRKLRDQMNQWGVAGCKEHMEDILDGLEKNAKLLKLAFSRKAARVLVKLAIFKARKSK